MVLEAGLLGLPRLLADDVRPQDAVRLLGDDRLAEALLPVVDHRIQGDVTHQGQGCCQP
ncbi:MAG: hypothetical protein PHD58_01180 [Anaerolineales bacterium]|nr:hypothetical protein [Anaerolineales bacterium]